MIKKVIWSSMVDYPDNICSVLFYDKCQMTCKYCYNTKLKELENLNLIDILTKLSERKEMIDHIILSGGECTQEGSFATTVLTLNNLGFKVGIHTNGLNINTINFLIDKIDFLGVDIKTSLPNFLNTTGIWIPNFEIYERLIKLILEKNKQYEFRTTILPHYTTLEDLKWIATFLKENGVKKYYLQKCVSDNLELYTDKEIEEILNECNKILPTYLKGGN